MKICHYNANEAGAVEGDRVHPIGAAMVKAGYLRTGYTMLDVIDALANNPNGVKDFFANTTNGWAVKFSSYLDSQAGDNGSLVTKQDNLTKESSSIDTQISDMERHITATRDQLTASFVAMEQAQARINQQLQYLTKNFA